MATVDFDETKDACDGLANGSIVITVTSGTPPFAYNLLRLSDFTIVATNVPLTLGVPTTISNLAPSGYIIAVTDGLPADNFTANFVILDIGTPLAGPFVKTDNTSCTVPNGSIVLNPSGGSGAGYTFQWQKDGVNYATTKDISGLAGGSYTVTIFDDSTNCSLLVGPIVIDDPSPVLQTITNSPDPFPVCTGEDLIISLGGSEPAPVVYEVINSTTSTPTGVSLVGTGGPLAFTLPAGTFSDGQTFIIRATNQLCAPADMTGSVTVDIVPLPIPTLAGNTSVCPTNSATYTTDPGRSNYTWVVSPGGTITLGGGVNDDFVTVTWTTPGTQTVSVNYQDPNGCSAATPTELDVTVNPPPVLVNPQAKTICTGDNVAYEILLTPANTPAGTLFNWPDPDGAGPATAGVNVPMGPAGTIHINDVLTNTTSAPINVTYQVTPTSGAGCPGVTQDVVITVSPRPVLVTPQAKTICSGENTAYEILLDPANLPVGTTFSWPDPDGAGPATAGVNVPMGVAGTAHINDVLTNVTGAPITVTYVVTPTTAGCSGTPQNVEITVNPAPVLVTPQTKTICTNENVAYEILLTPANLPAGTVFNWPDPDGAGPATAGVNVPMGPAGTIHINDVLTNTTSAPITVTYQVTPTSGTGCPGVTRPVVITVNPIPVLVAPQAKTICSGDNTAYEILLNPANLPTGTTFSWPDPDGAGPATADVNVPMGTAGTTHINDALTNTTSAPITVTYVVTPTTGTCVGTPQNVVITVNPRPVLVTPQAKTICSGDNVGYEILLTPANQPAGTVFNWPDPDGAGPATAGVNVPMGPAGTIHINDALTNTTSAPITVTYQVTPTGPSGCPGVPQDVVITVTPRPVLLAPQTKTICAGQNTAYEILLNPANLPAGTVFNWPDPDGAGPATAGVNVPMGAPGTTHINNVLTNATGAPIDVTYVITPSVNGCAGTPGNVVITVNPAPVLAFPQNKTICSGDNVAKEILLNPVNLPAGTVFNWPDPDGAGPATAGVNVPMGPAGTIHINDALINTTSAPITVTYQVTPSGPSGCPGTTRNIVITVNPRPVLVAPQAKTICSGSNVGYEILLTPANQPAGTTFSWPDPDGAGPATAGVNVPMGPAGTIHINDVLTNTTSVPVVVTYQVTATGPGGCVGTTQNVDITVSPTPVLVTPQAKTICSGANTAYEILLNPANLPAGTVFNWPDPDGAGPATAGVNVAMGAAGTTHINDVLTNTTGAPIVVNYEVTPSVGGCAGTPVTVAITVDPAPVLVTPQAKTICSGDNVDYEILLNPANQPAGTTFSWPDPDGAGPATAGVNVPMGPAGTIHIIDVLTNATSAPITVTYQVTPTSGSGCPGVTRDVVITVNPAPVLVEPQAKAICSGEAVGYEILLSPVNQPAGTTFSWPDPDGAGPATAGVNVPMGAAGTIHINDVLTNATSAPITVTYQVTPTAAGCAGVTRDIVITVNPRPVLVTPQAKTICSGSNVGYEILLNPANLPAGTVFNWPDPDGAGPATAGVNVPMGAAGTIHIDDVLTNTTAAPINVTYAVTASIGGGCPGTPVNVVITVVPAADAGIDGNAPACNTETAFDLFAVLGGTPQNGGTWTDADASGAVITGNLADFSAVTPGTYNFAYQVNGVAPCAPDVAVVTITISEGPNAGADANPTVCNTNNAFDLFAALGPTADAGGTWTDLDGSGGILTGDVIDLTPVAPGNYRFRYVVTSGGGPCPNDTSLVTINVINTAPDGGSDSTVAACNNETAFNLFNSIAGSPDPGGTWTDLDASGAVIIGNTVNLTTLGAGTYRFQYDLAVVGCGGASSVVTMNVTDGPSAGVGNPATSCSTNNAFDLFASLTGTPDAGGIWLDTDASGAVITGNIADLTSVTVAGTYDFQYVVAGTGPCENDTATVTLTIALPANAGGDNTVDVCNAETAFDLLTGLTGTPDATGTWTDLDGSGAVITGNAADFSGVTPGTYTFQYEVAGTAPCINDIAILIVNVTPTPDAGGDGNAPVCSSETAFDLFAQLTGTPDVGGTWVDANTSGAVITGNNANFAGVAAGIYEFQYVVSGVPCENDTASVFVTVTESPSAGISDDVTACNTNNAFDLLANLDGTPDAGGTWTDLDGSGGVITGDLIDLTTVGVVPGTYRFRYVVLGTGLCANDTSVLTINVINTTPDPGTDNTVSACNSETAFSLFASLGGTPDPGGVWTDLDGSGATISGDNVNLTAVSAGTFRFQYDLNVAGCGSASAVVTINVTDGPDAGIGNPATTCNTDNNFDLFALLTGTPDATGTWVDADASGAAITGNIADFTGVAAGTYEFQYVVLGTAPCVNDTAFVAVTIGTPPNAGTDNPAASSCASEASFDLFAALGGTPDNGGVWADMNSSGATITGNNANFTGVTVAGSYIFRYVVAGTGPCANDTSFVTVAIAIPPRAGTDGTSTACNSDNTFNLFNVLGGPKDTGGTWTDVNGSTAVITGNIADLTTVAAGTYDFRYVVMGSGTCANDTSIVTLTITDGPSPALAGPDQILCGAFVTNLAATPVTSGTGNWVIASGAGGLVVTPNSPTSQFIGAAGVSYTLRWIVTAGTCAPEIDTVVVNFAASPVVTSPVTICVNATAPNLAANASGALSYNWYQGTGASRVFLANTTGSYTPGAELDRTTPGSLTYEVTAVYGCGESPASQIVVNVSNTGACGGGGGTGTCATVVITPKPTAATCTNSDGRIAFLISPFVPAVNVTGVVIHIQGVSTTNTTITRTQYNDSVFTALPVGIYDYTITYGDVTCVKTGQVTIDQSGTVGTPVVSNIVHPTCAGSETGALTLDVAGETGNLLEWSLNGIDWTPFTAGSQITGLPAGPAPTFEHVISVRRDASDPCNAFVRVVLQDQNPVITASFDADPATCGNSDGSIHSIVAGGGSGGGYEFSINGTDFQTDDEFNDLSGGGYILTVRDGAGCTQTFPVNVTFPGFIDFSVVATDPVSCAVLGELEVSFDNPGTYEVGISFDPGVEPVQYETPYISSGAGDIPKRITNLNGGDYYVFVKTSGAACPTRKGPFSIFGPKAISFDAGVECISNTLVLRLTNVQGEAGNVDITVLNELLTPVDQFTETLTPGGSILINSEFHSFMSDDGRYIIQLTQTDICQIVHQETVDIPATITATVMGIKESYPDITTGAFTVANFNGGIVPYDIKIELDQAAVGGQTFETNFEEVEKNNNLQYEKKYQAVPAGLYNIYIVDSLGCNITITALVPLDTDIYVPNLFTPNNDGHNEVFFVRNLPSGNNKLVITNRWGKQVFKSDAYQNDWAADGVIDGIYFFQLKPEGKEAVTGWVEVLRGQKP